MAERSNAAVLKTVAPQGAVGSNPTRSGNGWFLERCESGRIGLPAKELYPKRVPGVRIPPSPKSQKSAAQRGIRTEAPAERSEEEAAGRHRKGDEAGMRSHQDDGDECRIPPSPKVQNTGEAGCQVPLSVTRL